MLYEFAFWFSCLFNAMCVCFLVVLAGRPPLVVIYLILRGSFSCYAHGFLIVSVAMSPLSAICAVLFVFLCGFDAICMVFHCFSRQANMS